MTIRKVILFGGTFDPIHSGHTRIAAEATEYICAEKTVFIPAKQSALKVLPPQVSGKDRCEMISLAISGNPKFELSYYELKQTSSSYTLDTVRKFRNDYGSKTSIYWLLGADTINDLPRWYKISELIDECNLSLVYRAGFDKPDFSRFESIWGKARTEKLQRNIVPTSLINISSTEIRKRLAAGSNVTDMLCPAVADYIRSKGFYKPLP